MHIFPKALFFLSLSFSLFSCTTEKDTGHISYRKGSEIEKSPMFYVDAPIYPASLGKEETLYCRLSASEFETLVQKKADFVLFLYAPGCSSCETAVNQFDSYIRKNNVILNYMVLDEYLTTKNATTLSQNSLLSYTNGTLMDIYDLSKTEKTISQILSEHTYTALPLFNTCYVSEYPVSHLPYFSISVTSLTESVLYSFNCYNSLSKMKSKEVLFIKASISPFDFSSIFNSSTLDGIFFYDEKDQSSISWTGLDMSALEVFTWVSFSDSGTPIIEKTTSKLD